MMKHTYKVFIPNYAEPTLLVYVKCRIIVELLKYPCPHSIMYSSWKLLDPFRWVFQGLIKVQFIDDIAIFTVAQQPYITWSILQESN